MVQTSLAERSGLYLVSEEIGSLVLSSGFDMTTVNRFLPTRQFLSEQFSLISDWVTFDPIKDSDTFQGFFSTHEWSSLENIHIYPLIQEPTLNAYILICASQLDSRRSPLQLSLLYTNILQFRQMLLEHRLFLELLSVASVYTAPATPSSERIDSALSAGMITNLLCLDITSLFPTSDRLFTSSRDTLLYRALVYSISRLAGISNICVTHKSFDIRIAIFSSLPLDPELYIFQFICALEKHFGVQRISKLVYSMHESSTDPKYIRRYLNGDR